MADYKANAADPVDLAPLDPGGSASGEVSEIAQYAIEWAAQIAGDTINTSTWFISGNVQQPSGTGYAAVATGTITKVWLQAATGATTGDQAVITNTIDLTSGAKYTRSFRVAIKTR